MKRAQQAGDEWAKIYALRIKEGQEQDATKKTDAAAKATALKQVLANQVAERHNKEEHEKQEELEYAAHEQVRYRLQQHCCVCCRTAADPRPPGNVRYKVRHCVARLQPYH